MKKKQLSHTQIHFCQNNWNVGSFIQNIAKYQSDGKENNTNQTKIMIDLIAGIVYIQRQILKSKKDYEVDILVELWLLQSRFWVYQTPPPYYDREVLKYMFRVHTYKSNQSENSII